jgi:hypothetical protein
LSFRASSVGSVFAPATIDKTADRGPQQSIETRSREIKIGRRRATAAHRLIHMIAVAVGPTSTLAG